MDISPINNGTVKFYQKKWFKIISPIVLILLIGGCAAGFKTGYIVNKISTSGSFLRSITKSIPGVKNELQGEEGGRINIALLGMRGENVPGGGLLADTIMVMSIKPQENKASIISVPRDLYVTVPGTQDKQKINAVHYYGEQKDKGQGLADMKKILGEISGQEIHYAISINFQGFTDLIDAVDGVTVHLDAPFSESLQFLGLEKRCDDTTFTVPSGNYEEKRIQRKNGTYYANPKKYPLCYAKLDPSALECGGDFTLAAGDNKLNGDQALCYARSRVTSNDFERARRQQQILQAFKDKLLSAGTLTDFGKLNSILDALGDNARTDMEAWEMKRFFDIYQTMNSPQVNQKVLENSEEGLLYAPENTNGAGYILLPRGDNYEKIKELFSTII